MTEDEQERLAGIYRREAMQKILQLRPLRPGTMEFHTLDEIVAAGDYADERLAGRKEPFNPKLDLVPKVRATSN